MKPTVSRTLGAIPPVRKALMLPSLALATVMARDGTTVYASSDHLFKGAIFGRDSLEVAEDLIYIKPRLVHNILLTLGGLQGRQCRAINEEEPGKIVHEFRSRIVDDKPLRGQLRELFETLNNQWGGDGNVLIYYASVDATPLFLRVLHTYCGLYGDAILDEKPSNGPDPKFTMREIARRATHWLTQKLDTSMSGLLEYKRASPLSGRNHVWKDSDEFYIHNNREPVNHDLPVASIEVQGLAYDALQAAGYFFPRQRKAFQRQAELLRDRTIELLWQVDRQYMALGIDHAPADGTIRTIRTATSNPADLLDSGFFDHLEPERAQEIVGSIVRRIMGADFLTKAGIRSRSLAEAHLVAFWDYHGSYVSWPKDTYDIAKGLRRQGFPRLAVQLENRLLNLVRRTRDYPEFVYVDGWGRVLPGIPRSLPSKTALDIQGTNAPERIQAWTVSAIMATMASRSLLHTKHKRPILADTWQYELETKILASMPKMNTYVNPLRLWLQYPTHAYRLSSPYQS